MTGERIKCVLLTIIYAVLLFTLATINARACIADVGTATTEVYVRDSDGDVVGSLAKGDRVIVIGDKGGWARVEIGGEEYRVWGDYLDVEADVACDDVEVTTKPRKSKTAEKGAKNGIRNKRAKSIKGSKFEDLYFW